MNKELLSLPSHGIIEREHDREKDIFPLLFSGSGLMAQRRKLIVESVENSTDVAVTITVSKQQCGKYANI